MRNPYSTIKTMLVTERSMDLKEKNKYVFKVDSNANKIEVKHAVEKLYDVEVAAVNIMNVRGKPKRLGRMMKQGRRPDFRKAVITLSKGSIEIV